MKIRSMVVIAKEYGCSWMFYRVLYVLKLRLMKCFRFFEQLFEKQITVEQMDIFSVSVTKLEEVYKDLSIEERTSLIQDADNACKGVIRGFSSVKLDFGNPIDWQLNPLTGKCCNAEDKWFNIPDFDTERGDIKVIWEASRFSQFILFARAYMITKDKKYYKAFSEQMSSWIKENPYSYGANYKCGQECSIRMINLLLAAAVFSDYGLLKENDRKNIRTIVERSIRKIESNFFYAYRCVKNNHTISELTGMIIGAWCQKDHKKLEKSYRILDKVIKDQFYEDGGYCQNSFNYQRLALQMMEIVYAIEKKTGLSVSKEARERVYKSAMLLYQVQDEKSGDVPNYGSNDGALIFPLTSCSYRDFRPVINTISGLEKNQFMYPSGIWEEEYFWLSNEVCSQVRRNKQTQFFETTGIYSYVGNNSKLMINFQQLKKRPSQMDQLHFDLWINGKNVFCDSGTYSYASELGGELISTLGHNTVYVSGKEQMKRRPPFLLYDWPGCKVVALSENEFEGVMESKNGYTHQRKIIYGSSQIVVTDKVTGDTRKGYEVIFHTPCEVVCENERYYIADKDQKLAEIQTTGKINLQKSYRSLYYLRKEKITRIHIRSEEEKTVTRIIISGGNEND